MEKNGKNNDKFHPRKNIDPLRGGFRAKWTKSTEMFFNSSLMKVDRKDSISRIKNKIVDLVDLGEVLPKFTNPCFFNKK